MHSRRALLLGSLAGIAAAQLPQRKFRISLAEWSLHRAIQNGSMSNLDFPRVAREDFGIEGLEFVNQLWDEHTPAYVSELKRNTASTGTTPVLIMVDREGSMGHIDRAQRMEAADNHKKWVDIAAELGCHSIRTNMYPGEEQPATEAEIDQFIDHCVESFTVLCEYAAKAGINVIIENHGGVSSDPDVVVGLMNRANLSNLGTLPDFGNFPDEIDLYDAVEKMMPYAKGVSLKCYDFTPDLEETRMDLDRLMKIVADAGYNNWVGIEYEGERLGEYDGIRAAKQYLDRLLAA